MPDGAVARFEWERALRDDDGLPSHVLATALALGTYMDTGGGWANPGVRLLASALGLSTRSVERHLSYLEAQRWLEVQEGRARYRSTTYRARVP